MSGNTKLYVLKFKVEGLTAANALIFGERLKTVAANARVDTNIEKGVARVVAEYLIELSDLKKASGTEFKLTEINPPDWNNSKLDESGVLKICIDGMTCHSCEVAVERKFKKAAGIKKVNVSAAKGEARIVYYGTKPDLGHLQNLIADSGYRIKMPDSENYVNPELTSAARPSFWQLIGLFTIVLILGKIFLELGLLKSSVSIGASAGFLSVFVLGLVAASSSCIAVSGGLMLSSVAKFNQRYGDATIIRKMAPVMFFVGGRILSYGLLGGLIGILGKALSPSPLVTGAIAVVAALYMLVMGLDMLKLAPAWLKGLMPKIPKSLSHKVLDQEGKEHPLAPFLLGAATFFLPCGFTQSLQLYALTTGSALTSALLLFAFALGTAPALIALGFASGSFKGKIGQYFFRFSGALVIVLGLWNIQNGFTIAGYPLSLPDFSRVFAATPVAIASANDPNVIYNGRQQIANIKVEVGGYTPNRLTLRQGVPTRLNIDGTDSGGCLSVFQIPRFGVRQLIKRDRSNVIEFTPTRVGPVTFSCGMGMFRGQINVVANNL